MAGVSKVSVPSASLECKEWTLTVPGIKKEIKIILIIHQSSVLMLKCIMYLFSCSRWASCAGGPGHLSCCFVGATSV